MAAADARRAIFRGCLLGGAVGDALGAGVEFMSLEEIRHDFGPAGITGYVPAYGRTGAITDDTQMTLFTAEGLIIAALRAGSGSVSGSGGLDGAGLDGAAAAIWAAYRRWLGTQDGGEPGPDAGWLAAQPFLRDQRAPGFTCLGALEAGLAGTAAAPANDSKGCGGVMRVAPIGLAGAGPASVDVFGLGCAAAALTHGHPSGYFAAGALAVLVREAADGAALPDAADTTLAAVTAAGPGAAEVAQSLRQAIRLAAESPGDPQALGTLGEGWVAEEALAIAVYCALPARDFRSAVLLAANHDGDSDSTAAICGNILGAAGGDGVIDADLLDLLEGRDVIEQVADDLLAVFARGEVPAGGRYSAA